MLQVKCIWDRAEYNAFPDLIRYRGRWLCVLREGIAHAGDHGTLRIITSEDGEQWSSLAELKIKDRDLRDAKFSIAPDGRLMLNTYLACETPSLPGQSISFFSNDGNHWQGPYRIGDPGMWLWRTDWHRGVGYSIGYGHDSCRFVRLYTTLDGLSYDIKAPRLYDQNGPSEYAFVFRDNRCFCLLRRDNLKGGGNDNGLFGIADKPFDNWQWFDTGHRIGGPEMIELPDGRLLAAVRKYEFNSRGQFVCEWLELCWINEENGTMTTHSVLPSGFDCSYAGMVWHNDELWMTYYSAHEEKPCIYLARGPLV